MGNSYYIDLTGAEDRTGLYDRIEQELPVPEWFGRNLDAFHDVLTEPFLGQDCRICFTGCAACRTAMPAYMKAMERMCRSASEKNPGLIIEFED